jgi:hypothetical protein
MAEVSDKAKTKLLKQQMGLLDTIEESTRGDDVKWKEYFYSVAPELGFYKGHIEKNTLDNSSADFIKMFRDCIFLGLTPPAMALVRIAEAFDSYLKDASTLSLDEAFRLKGKPRIGHPLKVKKHDQQKASMFFAISILRKLKNLSIMDAAGELINLWDIEAEDEALKKDYIKFIKNSKKQGLNTYEYDGVILTPELKEALESILSHAYTIYKSGIPQPELGIEREDGKEHLREHLISRIEKLGNK